MHDDLSLPEYIPEDVQSAHLDDARRQVARGQRTRTERRGGSPGSESAPRSRPAPSRVGAVATAVTLGLGGAVAMSVAWTWLAVRSGEAIWIAFALGGWIVTAAVVGVLARTWWRRSENTPPSHPRAQQPA